MGEAAMDHPPRQASVLALKDNLIEDFRREGQSLNWEIENGKEGFIAKVFNAAGSWGHSGPPGQ